MVSRKRKKSVTPPDKQPPRVTRTGDVIMDSLSGANPVCLTIIGRPASKKNNRRNYGKISLPSLAFIRFKGEAVPQLKNQFRGKPFDQFVRVEYHFYLKGNYKQDIDNAESSIADVLMDAGVLTDDWYIAEVHKIRTTQAPEWKTEIKITVLTKMG